MSSPNYVGGTGAFEPKLMIVGDYPSKRDNNKGEPFSDHSGHFLDECLRKAGSSLDETYRTNVMKFMPPFGDPKKYHLAGMSIEDGQRELWETEIKVINPNCILVLGEIALNAVTGRSGIQNYRGSILQANDGKTKVVCSLHPSQLYSKFTSSNSNSEDDEEGENKGGLDYVWTKLILADIKRAVDESHSCDINLPIRDLRVANNSLDLYRFFETYSGYKRVAVDIESINCIPVCVGFAFTRHHAISVPILKNIGGIELTDMSMGELVSCWRMIDDKLRALDVVGHNFKYDEFKLSLARFKIPNVISDTLIKLRVLFPELPEKKLATAVSLWTREPYYKEEGKEFKLGKSPISQLFLYNAKDCALEIEVDEETDKDLDEMASLYNVPLRSYYYDYMMKKHKFYLNMEQNGFAVDHNRQKELITKYINLQNVEHEKLTALIGHEINVKSSPQKISLLRELKLPVYKKNPTSEDSFVKMMSTHCKGTDGKKKQDIIESLLEETRIRDQRSRYINFSPDYDGRCKTSFNISATETCRSSTGVLKKPIRPRKMGLAFHTISKHGRLAKDIRSMFIPDKGKVLLQADGSQFQARVVAVLSEDWDLLKAFDTIDLHRRTAGLIFGYTHELILTPTFIPIVDEMDKDGPERFAGKKTRHAGNFDMKEGRFQQEVNTDAQKARIKMSISKWKAKTMLDAFHRASPKIKGKFHADIQAAIISSRVLIDPFGGVRVFNGRMGEELYKEAYANIPQRTEAHQIQQAALRIYDEVQSIEGVCFVSENHDSLTMSVPEKDVMLYAKLMKKEMESPIDFSTYCTLKRDIQLVIPVDCEVADVNYAEFRKVKF